MPFDGTSLDEHRALVLNADFRPLCVAPLSTYSWRDAVEAAIGGAVEVLAEYDRVVRSPTFEMRVPSVVALRSYQRLDRPAPLTRINLFIRDGLRCAYCGRTCATDELTFDHVHPRSRGGGTSFDNVVSACEPCNARKANRTPDEAGMRLCRKPYHPTREQLNAAAVKLPVRREKIEKTWVDFLYWEVELDE